MRRTLYAFLLLSLAACTDSERDFVEADIAQLHDHMQRGELSSEELVRWYIERVENIDRAGPSLNSIIEINPDALSIAKALDKEWKVSGPRGPLHGIPVVLKANIDTSDQMYTSAGSLALAEHVPPTDAFVVKRLRDAGAVILGKANLSEWANFRSTRSQSGWSSVGGQTLNPLRHPTVAVWFVQRFSGVRRRKSDISFDRHRDRRIRRMPGKLQRCSWYQANLGTCQ